MDYTGLLNDGSTMEGCEGLQELVGHAHEHAGWDYSWRHSLEALGLADDNIRVSLVESAGRFGYSHRLMLNFTWTYHVPVGPNTVRRIALSIAKWPLGLTDGPISDTLRQAVIDAGYGLAYSLQSFEKDRIAKMRAEFAARNPDLSGGNGNA